MHQIWSRRELEAAGATRRSIESALAAGTIIRVRVGWYASADIPDEILRAVAAGGRLTCISAARLAGLWIPPGCDERLHVAVPRNGPRPTSRCVVHWSDPDGTTPQQPVTTVAETLRVLAGCLSADEAFVIVESALHLGLVHPEEWAEVLATLPAGTRVQLAEAGPLSGSGTESHFVRRMRRLGIGVRQQVQVGPDRVDVELDDGQVVELDSREWHDPRVDARRDARVGIAGKDTLRFVYEQVWFEWPMVEGAVMAARARRAARRPQFRTR